EIGLPVFVTFMPRFRPSLAPMAIVRTTPSPSCCWTSSVRPTSSMTSASWMFGIASPENSTSTTAPMIWTVVPVLMCSFLSFVGGCSPLGKFCILSPAWRSPAGPVRPYPSAPGDCAGAADDLGDILRDRCLPRLVVGELQLLDQLAR